MSINPALGLVVVVLGEVISRDGRCVLLVEEDASHGVSDITTVYSTVSTTPLLLIAVVSSGGALRVLTCSSAALAFVITVSSSVPQFGGGEVSWSWFRRGHIWAVVCVCVCVIDN